MTAEIPVGGGEDSAAVEQPVDVSKGENTNPSGKDVDGKDDSDKASSKKNKSIVFVGVIVLLAVAAVLIALIPDWGKDGSTSDAMTQAGNVSSTGTPTVQQQSAFFESTDGPISFKLPLMSSNVTTPYTSIEDARVDVEQLARFIANRAITDGMSYNLGYPPETAPVTDEGTEADKGQTAESSPGDASFGGVSDFDTYEHEAGVVKSDFVKSNGELVFAAVEDRIHVWNIQGKLLSTTILPPLNVTYNPNDPPIIVDGDNSTTSVNSTTTETEDSATASVRSDIWWNPKPYVQALLLSTDGTRLTALVGGYGMELVQALPSPPVIYDYLATRIIVYDIVGGNLTVVSQTDINGYHRNSYSVGDDVHVVTGAGLDTYTYLVDPLSPWNPAFAGMTIEEYAAAAIALAEKIIPEFVEKILALYTVNGEIVLSRLSVFSSSISGDTEADLSVIGSGIVSAITEVASFDMMTLSASGDLGISRSATMQPGGWGYVYATPDWIWVADQGYNWVEKDQTYLQETFLVGFKLMAGATSSFSVIGKVPGAIINQFAVDFVNDNGAEFIRVATTLTFNWGWWAEPMPIDTVAGGSEGQNTTTSSNATIPPSRTKNEIFILEVPADDGSPDDNVLLQRGSIEVGKKDESITAVRFFDNLSYVVTFERTDPFYVLDLSNPDDPVVLGEVEIPGFSDFMHPISDDNTKLVTIGQMADEEGNILGFQVSLFDSTDPTKPTLVGKYVVNNKVNQYSGSSASWDERAFRYVKVGDIGRLIVPISIYSWGTDASGMQTSESFEGFMVFGVDPTKSEDVITLELKIDHTPKDPNQENNNGCYCYSWLPERSMVFDGNVMTMKAQSVISTNLVSYEQQWKLSFDSSANCCVGY